MTVEPGQMAATKIVVDNAGTAHHLTRYLMPLGHYDVAFVGGIPGLTAAEQRISGYRAAMVEKGLTPREPLPNGMSQESGRDAISRLLSARHIVEAETDAPEPPPRTLRVGTTTAPRG